VAAAQSAAAFCMYQGAVMPVLSHHVVSTLSQPRESNHSKSRRAAMAWAGFDGLGVAAVQAADSGEARGVPKALPARYRSPGCGCAGCEAAAAAAAAAASSGLAARLLYEAGDVDGRLPYDAGDADGARYDSGIVGDMEGAPLGAGAHS